MNKSQENIIDTLTDKTIQIFNLKEKEEYIKEVATLEHEEWAENPEENKKERIERKTNRIKNNLANKDFCKLILLKNEAKKRGYKEIFLKTELSNYYEKFGAIYIRKLKTGEKLYKIELHQYK